MIQVGDIVTHGTRPGRWVALNLLPSHNGARFWRLVQDDVAFEKFETELALAVRPVLTEGLVLTHQGSPASVVTDLGENVIVRVGTKRRELQGGGAVAWPPANVTASKAALVCENIIYFSRSIP